MSDPVLGDEPFRGQADAVEIMARAIADGLGDSLDNAHLTKSEWNATRGEKGGRFRDINEPMRDDYLASAQAVIAALNAAGLVIKGDEPSAVSPANIADDETAQGESVDDVTIPGSLFRDMHAAYLREPMIDAELKALRTQVAWAIACLTLAADGSSKNPTEDRE